MPNTAANSMMGKLDEIAGLLRRLIAKEQPSPRRLLRLAEAADYLHISPWSLRGIIQRGELPIVKPGESGRGPWLLDRVELDRWIERTKVTL